MHLDLPLLLPDGRAAGLTPDGRLVRVGGAVPGDRVEVGELPAGRTVDVPAEIVLPSPARRIAPCPVSAACGGCDLDALEPAAREASLVAMLAHVFRWDGPVPFVRSPRMDGHRARIKLAIRDGALGYFAARSHRHVPVDLCRIARPEVQQAHAHLVAWLAVGSRSQGLDAVELRSDGTRVVYAFESAGDPDRAALVSLGDVALDGRRLSGNPTLEVPSVDGLALRASPRSFYQVNLEVNALLAQTVRDALLEAGVERVLDLYAGIGNLGLPIAAAGVPVVAVEAPGPAADDLRHNARPFGRTEIVAIRAERFDPSRTPFDGVVLDPPRAGAPGVLARLGRNRPKRIVYVSCFSPNAARDLAELDRYALVSLTAFDLFPDTHHVEALAVLDRR